MNYDATSALPKRALNKAWVQFIEGELSPQQESLVLT